MIITRLRIDVFMHACIRRVASKGCNLFEIKMKKIARQTEREKQIYINRDILQHEKLFFDF